MKNKLTNFLDSRYYPLAIITISLIIWSFKFYLTDDLLNNFTFYGIFFLTVPYSLLLIFKKNTIHSVMPLLALLFTVGITNLGIDSFKLAFIGFLNGFLIAFSMIFHLIYYKVKLSLKSLGISLILISVSFLIPLVYTEINEVSILLSSLGLIYLFIYLFYTNTLGENETKNLMRYIGFIAYLLSFQLLIIWVYGLTIWENGDIINNFITIFNKSKTNPGWGNINDLTIHLVLSSFVFIYYIEKYPKRIIPFLSLGWITFWIYISNARGSIITVTILMIVLIIYYIIKGNFYQRKNLLITLLIALLIITLFGPIINSVWDNFISSIYFNNPNKTLTGRINLWWKNENSAWNLFLERPLLGNGWYTDIFNNQNRITIYHSTFFQVLATGGLLGIGFLIYHYYKVFNLFKEKFYMKASIILFLALLLTQFHGLFDNTQYMIHFSIYTFIIFSTLENTVNDENGLMIKSLL